MADVDLAPAFHILSKSLICCIFSCCGGICFLWQVSGLISNRAGIWGLQIDCQLEISLCTLFQEMFLYFLDSSISSEKGIHPEWRGEQCYQIVPPLGFKQNTSKVLKTKPCNYLKLREYKSLFSL